MEREKGRTYAQCNAPCMIQTNERISTNFGASDAEKHTASNIIFSRGLILSFFLFSLKKFANDVRSTVREDKIDMNASARNID